MFLCLGIQLSNGKFYTYTLRMDQTVYFLDNMPASPSSVPGNTFPYSPPFVHSCSCHSDSFKTIAPVLSSANSQHFFFHITLVLQTFLSNVLPSFNSQRFYIYKNNISSGSKWYLLSIQWIFTSTSTKTVLVHSVILCQMTVLLYTKRVKQQFLFNSTLPQSKGVHRFGKHLLEDLQMGTLSER